MKIFFSKGITGDFAKIKSSLLTRNSDLLKEVKKINNFYMKQPFRKKCKNCNYKLGKVSFQSFGIPYKICKKCNHVNGEREDTKKFLEFLYYKDKQKSGIDYSKRYLEDYDIKVKNIYTPKVNFLKKVIKNKIKIFDIGCGAGHFLKSCEKQGINGTGVDTHSILIDLANRKLIRNSVKLVHLEDFDELLKKADGNCVSLISVLEHIQKPSEFLKIFKKSKFKYLYISIPLFSFTSLVEHAFPEVFPRNLYGPHTHMYTKESIYYIIKKSGLKILGEWWFGSDFADLARSLIVKSKSKNSKDFKRVFDNNFYKLINNFQNILDKNKISSDLQMIITK